MSGEHSQMMLARAKRCLEDMEDDGMTNEEMIGTAAYMAAAVIGVLSDTDDDAARATVMVQDMIGRLVSECRDELRQDDSEAAAGDRVI